MGRKVIVELGLTCALLFAQRQSVQPPSSTETQSLRTGRIQGTVVNGNTGNPIKNARLTLQGLSATDNRRYSAASDDAGHFVIEDVAPGQFRLAVERNGFVSQEYGAKGVTRDGATLTISAGQLLEHVDLRLIPHCAISGRVVDEDGEPLPYVLVQAMDYGYSHGKRDLHLARSASTNDLGEYRIYGLAAGKYYISAMRQDRRWFGSAPRSSAKFEERYVPTYYPNSLKIEAASPLDLSPGAQLQGVDLALLKTLTFSVRGRVISGPTGKPLGQGMLMLAPKGSKSLFWGSAKRTMLQGPEGSFEFVGVTPGAYSVIAQGWTNEAPEFAQLAVEVGERERG